MARRTASKQKEHDGCIKKIATRLYNDGWEVWADIPKWPTPPFVGSVRKKKPDIYAKKVRWKKVIEVETEDTIEQDSKQHSTFRRAASHSPNIMFELYVAKNNRCRKIE